MKHTSRSRVIHRMTAIVTVAVYTVFFAVLIPHIRSLYSVERYFLTADHNNNGIPDVDEDRDANGIRDQYQDDDGDGIVDSFDAALQNGSEFAQSSEICDDGLDNDGNGLIDGADPACKNPAPTADADICNDGLDNDGDGKIDRADLGCTCQNRTPATESPDKC